jgi:BolA protein
MTYTPQQRQELIESRLGQALAPTKLVVIDESHQHIGHEGAKGGASHFALTIVSEAFTGLSSVKRHQLIYSHLTDLIPQEIHALKITAKTPQE